MAIENGKITLKCQLIKENHSSSIKQIVILTSLAVQYKTNFLYVTVRRGRSHKVYFASINRRIAVSMAGQTARTQKINTKVKN